MTSTESSNQEFAGYMPETTDPGPVLLFGTMGICFALLIAAHLLISCIHRRRKHRRAKKAAMAQQAMVEAEDSDENLRDLMPYAETVFERRVMKKDGKRLKGWSEIVTSIEEEPTRERKSAPPDAAEMFERDLFEDGGLVHQINDYIHADATLTKDDTQSDTTFESTVAPGDDYILMEGGPSNEPEMGTWRYLMSLLRLDREMKKLLKLAIPYSMSALLESVFDILTLAVIGRMLGTHALSAYVMVYYAVKITTMFLEGLMTSLTSLCSQAIGAKQKPLAGQYVQIAVVLYGFLYLPQAYLWWFHLYDFMLWMEFDMQAAVIGRDYARVYLVHGFVNISHSGLVYLLEVCGHENFAAVTNSIHSAVAFVVKIIIFYVDDVPLYGSPTLELMGVVDLTVGALFFLIELRYITSAGWLREYTPGLFGSFALFNFRAVKFFVKVALPLSFGFVLSYGEWEVMFLLAGVLGPAEVAVWGILGEVWGALETLTSAWGDAAEVRCATLLGAGEPALARLSAHKAMLLGTVGAGILSALLLALKDFVPSLITDDITLQYMLEGTLPLVALGNVALALGTISWQLIGAQSRYSLATAVELLGSWLVTLPLALLSCFFLKWTIESLVAAVVLGCMCSGMLNYAILRCTNWGRISAKMMKRNAKIAAAGDDRPSDGHDEESGYVGGAMDGDGIQKSVSKWQPNNARTDPATLVRVLPPFAAAVQQPPNNPSSIELQKASPPDQATVAEKPYVPVGDLLGGDQDAPSTTTDTQLGEHEPVIRALGLQALGVTQTPTSATGNDATPVPLTTTSLWGDGGKQAEQTLSATNTGADGEDSKNSVETQNPAATSAPTGLEGFPGTESTTVSNPPEAVEGEEQEKTSANPPPAPTTTTTSGAVSATDGSVMSWMDDQSAVKPSASVSTPVPHLAGSDDAHDPRMIGEDNNEDDDDSNAASAAVTRETPAATKTPLNDIDAAMELIKATSEGNSDTLKLTMDALSSLKSQPIEEQQETQKEEQQHQHEPKADSSNDTDDGFVVVSGGAGTENEPLVVAEPDEDNGPVEDAAARARRLTMDALAAAREATARP